MERRRAWYFAKWQMGLPLFFFGRKNMTSEFIEHLHDELAGLREDGLYKDERVIISK